eukprot:CAMPEP_0172397656 /NCGR_PEP_ID=MMETSP1061-20121228/31955_1 /TAXON_ID=37318 /ORGANISM="Pseudo-nitzschia pungens, Strain cf. pungens" /LENGTH=53 /DNA_ID=CAMNT_0013129907 /DNA_START=18 /DNA_END=176 /DNA_ORIENTATION=-
MDRLDLRWGLDCCAMQRISFGWNPHHHHLVSEMLHRVVRPLAATPPVQSARLL